ncbi:hypothetical protein AALH30_00510 [Blautia pseudococcoides]|uniref:hypothetical protein n=1 Tax=Blautia pseudococcoides TaxID=1796616 RepID=UPI00148B221F|nr:hypothetical protein [Blautia pseudococcoides]QJU14426.1 hypothetical protein HL650_08150 [Blautia pseudococcoides]
MRKYFQLFCFILCSILCTILLTSCIESGFDGSRTGNENQFIMSYRIFNTTDSQLLELEKGDMIDAEIICDSGRLWIKIQKDHETPVYAAEKILTSNSFQVPIEESGTYKITVTGGKAKGSVSFKRIEG